MSLRVPLPLRLIQSSLFAGTASAVLPPTSKTTTAASSSSSPSSSSLVFVYKPSGLPLFSASQVQAATHGPEGVLDLRHLLGVSASSLAHRPTPEDTSDSVFARLEDTMAPGQQVYLGCNAVSPALLQNPRPQPSHTSSGRVGGKPQGRSHGELVLQLLAQEKGIVAMASSQSEAFFLRNAEQLGLVRSRFHVLCRLPAGVAENVRAHARHRARSLATTQETVRNPYLRAYLEQVDRHRHAASSGASALSRPGSLEATDRVWSYGVPTTDFQTGRLPHDVAACESSQLVSGSLFDVARGVLRRHGRLVATVGLPSSSGDAPGPSSQRRLSQLFLPNPPAVKPPAGTRTTPTPIAEHPWIPLSRLLTVLPPETRADAAGARRVSLDFSLLTVSAQPGNPLALYEVAGHATAEDVRAIFASQGCVVVNDFSRDVELATLMQHATDAVHHMARSASSGVATLPARTQHQLLHAPPEALVWSPLVSLPLELADWAALHQSHYATAVSSESADQLSEVTERVRRYLHTHMASFSPTSSANPSSSSAHASMQRTLLWRALAQGLERYGSAPSATAQPHARPAFSPGDVLRLLSLAFGSGVECCGISLPDPRHGRNVLAMQHLVNRLNSPRGGIAAHTPGHVEEVSEQLKRISVDLDGGAGGGMGDMRHYGVAPYYDVLLDAARQTRAASGQSMDCVGSGYTNFTYALALQQPGVLSPDVSQSASPSSPLSSPAASSQTWAPSMAAVLELTTVPAAFSPSVASWSGADQDDATTPRRDQSLSEQTAAVSPLVQPRTGRTGEALRSWLEAQIRCSDAGQRQQHGVAGTLLLRLEEVAELSCAFCGAHGHIWSDCHDQHPSIPQLAPQNAAYAPPPMPESSRSATDQVHSEGQDGHGKSDTSTSERDSLEAVSARTVLQSSLLLHRDEVAAALSADADHISASRYGGAVVSTWRESDELVRVPNQGPSAPLNLHALRHEQNKPAMHRRSLRCAYCHGRHHITACPRLADTTTSPSATLTGSHRGAGAAAHDASERSTTPLTTSELTALEQSVPDALFCLRCGGRGHLVSTCPHVPADLHTATHCPICLQPRSKLSRGHTPEHCPRAKKVPSSHTEQGIAKDVLEARAAAQRERVALHRQKSRRRRGSMLVADSFVDRRDMSRD